MTTNDMIRDGKLHCNITRVAEKVRLSSQKIDKYECVTGEETLPSNQRQIIELAKFSNFLLGRVLEKQTEKQVAALKLLDLFNKKYEFKQI